MEQILYENSQGKIQSHDNSNLVFSSQFRYDKKHNIKNENKNSFEIKFPLNWIHGMMANVFLSLCFRILSYFTQCNYSHFSFFPSQRLTSRSQIQKWFSFQSGPIPISHQLNTTRRRYRSDCWVKNQMNYRAHGMSQTSQNAVIIIIIIMTIKKLWESLSLTESTRKKNYGPK